MGLTPPAWTPNKTGQDLRKQDETRAGASARRVDCCCSDGAPHGFCFALLAMATRRPSRNPDRAPVVDGAPTKTEPRRYPANEWSHILKVYTETVSFGLKMIISS